MRVMPFNSYQSYLMVLLISLSVMALMELQTTPGIRSSISRIF